ncbi:putative bifunctional dTTP/UTP pyrophosphatase/methyltransferase protein isoform X1 [Dermacentor variabilis]|uniref:putative bifunctional dTTP/UTP pyrophosphatase/methyltransferase protein isoform X1 n=1 Tax=Dermacentor variabilis TaxID=34621 RepID=UPI003F5B69A5
MLEPLLCALDKKRIVLASASPRRKEILNMLGFRYDVVASSFEENLDKHAFTTPAEYCVRTAEGKARDVARVLQQKNEAVDLVIGADTIVVKGNSLYEKPKDSSDAERMLNELSGEVHSVQTGVALIYRCNDDFRCMTFHETTEVFMAPMSQEIIKAYVRTGEPLDKAGAYAIQGKGGSLVEKIVGDFYNVMGFPLHRFCKELGDLYAKLGNVK